MPDEPGSADSITSDTPDQSDAALVGRALAGEDEAFAESLGVSLATVKRRVSAAVQTFGARYQNTVAQQ